MNQHRYSLGNVLNNSSAVDHKNASPSSSTTIPHNMQPNSEDWMYTVTLGSSDLTSNRWTLGPVQNLDGNLSGDRG